MKKSIALLGTIAALALSGTSANAAAIIVPINTPMVGGSPYFVRTDGGTLFSFITANFGVTIHGSNTPFDYKFAFSVPTSGIGSGSLSASFSGASSTLNFTSVLIDTLAQTITKTASGQSVVSTVPISAGFNTIEVIGITGPKAIAATFAGTATFIASPVPEPATWATFLLGFGFMGLALRRKLSGQFKTA